MKKEIFMLATLLIPFTGVASASSMSAQSPVGTVQQVAISTPVPLNESDLDSIHGEGAATGVAGAIIGGTTGAIGYGIDLIRTGQKGSLDGALYAIGSGAAFGAIAAYIPLP